MVLNREVFSDFGKVWNKGFRVSREREHDLEKLRHVELIAEDVQAPFLSESYYVDA